MVLDFGRKLDEIFKQGVDDLRKILPAGRGGYGPTLGKDGEVIAKSRRLKERVPLRTTKLPATPQPSIARRFAESAALRSLQETTRDDNMNREEAIMTVMNDPSITLTEAMLPLINDPSIMMDTSGQLFRNQFQQLATVITETEKKKRKPSKYQKELGKQLKLLKKKHPRTPIVRLMKKAHRATKKALK